MIDLFIRSLQKTRNLISDSGSQELFDFFQRARDYRDSLTITSSGPIPKVHEIYCDMVDETGGIAALATILSNDDINIKNIGIIHNREFQDGVLHMEFYEADARNKAIDLLRKYDYTVYE